MSVCIGLSRLQPLWREPGRKREGHVRTRLATLAKIGATAAATFVALALALYAISYRQIAKVYKDWGRAVVQIECGQVLPDQRLYALTPGTCRFANGEFSTRIAVDADGYRNDPRLMGAGPIQVAVTGDSHAFGWGVADHETFAARLARRPDFRVRNLAMSSYGTAREMLTLTQLAPDARLVVIQYCDNDLRENLNFLTDPARFGHGEEVQRQMAEIFRQRDAKGIRWSQLWKATVVRGLGWVAGAWRLMLLPKREPGPEIVEPQDLPKEADAFARVLAHFRSYLDGRQVIVLETNNWGRVRPGFADAFAAAAAANGLRGIRFVNSSDVLSRRDFFDIDEHMTREGHAKLERLIWTAWSRRGSP